MYNKFGRYILYIMSKYTSIEQICIHEMVNPKVLQEIIIERSKDKLKIEM